MMLNYIKDIILNLSITDIVDIGIIAAFIYFMLIWFKKARARFMLIGMVIVGSVYFLARFFGLYLTTIVFQAFFAIVLIMIVVIFQEDFRRFFERIGVWGITHTFSRKAAISLNAEMLSSALAVLSRKKIGALVVVRGKDPLERHLAAGTNLDGVLSQILLEALFDPNSPSHDGAVIIEGLRVAKFGCHLPLSTNVQEIGRLGTRHAAALGLSERSDALCIVVSEERGAISIAEGDRIRELSDATALRNALEVFYRKKFPRKKKTFFMDFLTGHFLEKVLAVVLAGGLWLALGHRTEVIRRDFVVPIEYRNLAQKTIIGEPKPKEVTVTLSGSEREFSLLNINELKLSLDMSGIRDGEEEIFLTKDLVRNTGGLSVVNIQPDGIELKVFSLVSRVVSIDVKTKGRLPPGVSIREIRTVPKEVSVIAPSTISKDKINITTEPIDLSVISETVTLSPKLIIGSDLRFPDDKYPEIKVIVEVEQKK